MMTRPGWPQDAAALKAFTKSADIGLHLNLTLGPPLGPMPALAPAGQFPALAVLSEARSWAGCRSQKSGPESLAQIEAFAQHFGRLPAYVDGHTRPALPE